MTSDYKAVLEALRTVTLDNKKPAVIAGSLAASSQDYPLPAFILDLENPDWRFILEDGETSDDVTRMSLIVHDAIDEKDPTRPMQRIETLAKKAIEAIRKVVPDGRVLTLDTPSYGPLEFGRTQMAEALAIPFIFDAPTD